MDIPLWLWSTKLVLCVPAKKKGGLKILNVKFQILNQFLNILILQNHAARCPLKRGAIFKHLSFRFHLKLKI